MLLIVGDHTASRLIASELLFWCIIKCRSIAATGRKVTATMWNLNDSNSQFRVVLAGIDADLAQGRLGETEAQAAKAELAREILRQQAETERPIAGAPQFGKGQLLLCIGIVAALALGSYVFLGSPAMPSQPLTGRADVATANIDLEDALAKIEAQLAKTPDDLRGWAVIAPVYMQRRRYEDAEQAFRQIINLAGPTADTQTRLAEAIMLQMDGDASGEPLELLQSAASSDPDHVLSRLYIAAELTRLRRYDEAVSAWEALLSMAKADEPWLAAVREGLLVAQNKGVAPESRARNLAEADLVPQMVERLAGRLEAGGGTIEEWTQLVRAYLVLDDTMRAQVAYDRAVGAYPRAFDRGDLDGIALGADLKLNGPTP